MLSDRYVPESEYDRLKGTHTGGLPRDISADEVAQLIVGGLVNVRNGMLQHPIGSDSFPVRRLPKNR